MRIVQILGGLLSIFLVTAGEIIHHYYWRDYRGYLPHDGVSFAGIYVAQIPGHGILPASFYPETEEAVSEVFGEKIVSKKYIKILCDSNIENLYWEHTTTEDLSVDDLDNLVVGGIEGDIPLYVGKVFHEGAWKISKVISPDSQFRGFKAWYNLSGTQHHSDDFEVLKYKKYAISPRC